MSKRFRFGKAELLLDVPSGAVSLGVGESFPSLRTNCLALGDALVPDPGGDPSALGKLVKVPIPILAEIGLVGANTGLSFVDVSLDFCKELLLGFLHKFARYLKSAEVRWVVMGLFGEPSHVEVVAIVLAGNEKVGAVTAVVSPRERLEKLVDDMPGTGLGKRGLPAAGGRFKDAAVFASVLGVPAIDDAC